MRTARLSLLAALCLGRALAVSVPAIPLSFEQRDEALFVARSGSGAVWFRPATVMIGGITLHFVKSLPEARLEGVGPASPATYINAADRRTFSQFPRLAVHNLYPGMDAVFYGQGNNLEYDLELAPGASPNRLCLWFENARHLRLADDGSLIAESGSGELRQMPPRVFQGKRQVPAHYVLAGSDRVAIRLGKYDARLPLTIDPVLSYAKYFGGSGSDTATAVATDTQDNVYVAGHSNSPDFPAVDGVSSKPLPPLLAFTNTGQNVAQLPIGAENSVTAIGGTPDGNILYVATSGGIYYSANGGTIWRQTAPLPAPIFSPISAPLLVNDISVDVVDPSRAYVASNRGIFSTSDNGLSWSSHDYGLAANYDSSIAAASITVSQVDHTILYATTSLPNYLYKSTDATGTWKILNPAYPGEPVPSIYATPQIIFTLVPGGTDLYVVDGNSILLKSSDGGATWQKGADGLFGARAIRVDAANPSTVFVLDNFGVQKSSDGGLTFASVNPAGVAGLSVTAFAYDSISHALYLAASGIVYASADQGVNWQTAPESPATFHMLQAFGGRVFAGLDSPQTTFLVKFDPTGARLLYSTFFTANAVDNVMALRVDAQGNAYLAGNTFSQNFGGAIKLSAPSPPSFFNSYVAKVASDGTKLAWMSIFGGSSGVYTQGLAIDSNGSAYVTGETSSPNFPTTPNAFQASVPTATCTRPMDPRYLRVVNSGSWAFVSKLSPDGSAFTYSTFLTGACGSFGESLAVNAAGEAFVTGVTTSGDMPVSSGAYQGAFPGSLDQTSYPNAFTVGFLARLSAAGDRVLNGTYIGGGYDSAGNAIALDPSGNPIVTGATWGITPGATPGAYQTAVRFQCTEASGIGPIQTPVNGADAFALKLDPTLSKAAYLTYLGGSCYDSGSSLALDPTGNVWIGGISSSADFPQSSPYQARGGSNTFVSELSLDGSKLLFSSFSDGNSVATDSKGFAYVAGSTILPVLPKRGGPSSLLSSASLARIDPAPGPAVVINSIVSLSASQAALMQPYFAGAVAPGELVRIEGLNLGPATKVDAQLDSTGRLPFTAVNSSVFFDSFPAPIISVQDTAIVCFVPFEVSQVTQVTVQSNGQRSSPVRVGVSASLPQILVVANQDGTANSASNPAAQGSVINLYVTGWARLTPPVWMVRSILLPLLYPLCR